MATALALSLGLPAVAGAADSSNRPQSATAGASSVASLQTQAEELAGQINADDQTLAELDESYDAGQIAYAQLQTRQTTLKAEMAKSSRQVAAARHTLQEEAILAYLSGGAPIIQSPAEGNSNAELTLAYASILAGGEKVDEDRYRDLLATQAKQQSDLVATERNESVTMADISADRSQAATTLAAQQTALAQVKGQLAVAVAAVQASEQAAEQAQFGPAGGATRTTSPGGSSPSGPAAPSGGSLPSSSTTSPAVTSTAPAGPTTTSPPTTASPSTTTPTTTPPTSGSGGTGGTGSDPTQAPGVSAVLAYAQAQLGKPYQWGGAGPNSFDCSGLVMMAWAQAGIEFPHLAQDQYDMTARIALSDMIPGDLVFYGTPDDVYHVGIYIGGGNMIDAPETGQDVSIQNIYWSGLLGAGRVTSSS